MQSFSSDKLQCRWEFDVDFKISVSIGIVSVEHHSIGRTYGGQYPRSSSPLELKPLFSIQQTSVSAANFMPSQVLILHCFLPLLTNQLDISLDFRLAKFNVRSIPSYKLLYTSVVFG